MQSDPVAELSCVLGGFHSPPNGGVVGFLPFLLRQVTVLIVVIQQTPCSRTCPCPHAAPNGADSGDRAVHMQGKGTNAGYHLPSSTLPFWQDETVVWIGVKVLSSTHQSIYVTLNTALKNEGILLKNLGFRQTLCRCQMCTNKPGSHKWVTDVLVN